MLHLIYSRRIHDPNNPNILTAVYTIKVVEKRDSGIYR